MREVYEYLRKCGTYYLATMDGDQPRVRPFGTIDEFDGKLYILTGAVKPVSNQIFANPRVELCAVDGDNWIRVQAVAVPDDRRESKQHMLDTYPFLQDTYSADDDNTQLFYLSDAVATISSFAGALNVIRF